MRPSRTKTLIFIRHPQFAQFDRLFLDDPNRDVEEKMPISRLGLKQARLLAEHLKQTTARGTQTIGIYCSPTKRAKELAEIVATNLKLAKAHENLPVGRIRSGHPQVVEALAEVVVGVRKAESQAIEAEAKRTKKGFFPVWFEKHPKEAARRMEQKRQETAKALQKILSAPEPMAIIFSHGGALTALLWHLQQTSQGKNPRISTANMPRVLELRTRIGHTSISRASFRNRMPVFVRTGKFPHLKKEPGLITGTFRYKAKRSRRVIERPRTRTYNYRAKRTRRI